MACGAVQVTELSDSPQPEPQTQTEEASPSSEKSFRLIVETIPGRFPQLARPACRLKPS
jgi:hypothetical protein